MSVFEARRGRISGQGTRTIILSHGFGSDQSAFDGIRPWLDARYRTVTFDLAGAGPGGATSFDQRRHGSLYGYADDLLAIIDELDLDGAVYVGHSVSGMIGAAAAVARPDAFAKLVLIGSSARYRNDSAYHGGFDQAALDGLFAAMSGNFQAWAAGFAPTMIGVANQGAISEFSRTMVLMRPDIALDMARMIFQSDMRAVAAQVATPTHIIQAKRDAAVPHAAALWLHDAVGGSTFALIEAEGHLPHVTRPETVIEQLALQI